MGKAAVWAAQMLWPILPRALRIVLLVLVSSSRQIFSAETVGDSFLILA